MHLHADAGTWLGVLAGERNMLWGFVRGKVRVKGSLALLKRFKACFA